MIQVYKVYELDAVSKRAAGSDYGVFEGKRAYVDAKVNFPGPSRSWGRLRCAHRRKSTTQVKV
jgi:hypothetical protein